MTRREKRNGLFGRQRKIKTKKKSKFKINLLACTIWPWEPSNHHMSAPTAPSATPTGGVSAILPLEMIDKCIGSSIWVVMRTNREFVGTLLGFDDYVSTFLFHPSIPSCPIR